MKNKRDILKKNTIREFSNVAADYDSEKNYREVKDDYQIVLGEIDRGYFDSLLDCGCGTGNLISMLAKRFPNKRYLGVDITEKMIDVARKKAIPGAEFICSDSENMKILVDTFDVITCVHSFHHYPHPKAFLKEAYRLLKKNGRLIIRDNAENNAFMHWWMNRVFLPIYSNGMRKSGDIHEYSPKEMRILADEVGLEIEQCRVDPGHKLHCVMKRP